MRRVRSTMEGLGVAAGLLAGALAAKAPPARSLAERLAMLPATGWPLRSPVAIRWNTYAVPFIEAAHDEDLAVALGAVQAHLRLAQLQIMRRIALGRVSEMAGPIALGVDQSLRSFDFTGPVPGIIDSLSPETRRWAENFLAGLNHHITTAPELPHDAALLGIGRETWTLEDMFAVARLAGADVSWIVFARLLRARRQLGPSWDGVWQALLRSGSAAPAGAAPGGLEAALSRLGRMGSNSAAVAGRQSASGGAMIASDPHLGLGLPNLWLVAGMRSPSFHVVGLMLAGFPFMALGRNPWCAWGGTSLHAAGSDLVDLSGREGEITERRVEVRVRGAGRRRLTLRSSRFGPVVSDGALLRAARPLALRWVGQAPSDEFGAMLAVMRARDWDAFRGAFRSFAVPGQTMVFAGADGRLGRLLAGHLPRRPNRLPEDLAIAPAEAWSLDDFAVLSDEAFQFDPPEGFVASANDRPPDLDFPVGFFFSPPDRAARLRALLDRPGEPLTLSDMRALQADVVQPAALRLRDALVGLLPSRTAAALRRALLDWDGSYDRSSPGALAVEVMLGSLARDLPAARRLKPVAGIWTGRMLVADAILRSPASEIRPAMARAAARASRTLRRHRSWGRIHRAPLRHPLSRLPLLGRRFDFGTVSAAGSNDTLNKTGHGFVLGPHEVSFGTCARHISDLADPDANYFVLFGGQDGWIGSANLVDQAPLWRDGRYIQVPMRPETVAASFPHETVLRPA